jgi:antagonist of KipI
MTIYVQSPGMLTTVQDLGRFGYGPIGVSPSGAADPLSLRIGNLLVGNLEGDAALEITMLGGSFTFPEGALVAIAGADFECSIPMWKAHRLQPGETLKIGGARSGARCYLCVHGGIAVKALLGSASTHLLSGLGGQLVKRGDVLPIGESRNARPRTISQGFLDLLKPRKSIRATIGPQSDWFSRDSVRTFFTSAYTVTDDSNRMGLRLEGPALETPQRGQMISEGVSLGAIQIPASGKPIILFVEQQTTGGYPKIANVISADLPSVGQLRPRDEIRFELATPEAARAFVRDQEELIVNLKSM